MKNSVKERTLEFIAYKGISMKQFELDCNLSTGYVTSMRKSYGPEKLSNVLNAYPELSRDWLLYGEGSMLKTENEQQEHMAKGETFTGMKERVIKLLEFLGLTAQQFELRVGLSNGAASKMGDGTRRSTLDKISNAFPNVNINWLLTGEGSMLKTEDDQPEPKVSLNPAVGRPYYDVDFLGGYGELFNDGPSAPLYNIDFPPYNKDGVTWCNITGHSMEPRINSGDIIALKEIVGWQDYIIYGEIYAIVTSNDMRTIKIIRKSKQPDHLRLVPINTTDFDEQDIPIKIITHLYKVLCSVSRY